MPGKYVSLKRFDKGTIHHNPPHHLQNLELTNHGQWEKSMKIIDLSFTWGNLAMDIFRHLSSGCFLVVAGQVNPSGNRIDRSKGSPGTCSQWSKKVWHMACVGRRRRRRVFAMNWCTNAWQIFIVIYSLLANCQQFAKCLLPVLTVYLEGLPSPNSLYSMYGNLYQPLAKRRPCLTIQLCFLAISAEKGNHVTGVTGMFKQACLKPPS